MTTTLCPHCCKSSSMKFAAKDYNRRMTDETFSYYCCNSCGLIYLSPIPRDLGKYYPSSYYDVPRSITELDATARKLQQWKIDLVKRHSSRGRLLEIGPAYGLFSHLAKQAGFDVTAIEMDSRCCEFLRETVGINVIQDLDTVAAMDKLPQFDVIVLWQVLEHLPDPWVVLDAAARRLAPNGVLILDTPNPQAFQFGVLGRYWTHVDAPRHVTLIPVKLIVDQVARGGLRPEVLTAVDESAKGFNGFGWAFSFKNFFGETAIGRTVHFLGRVLAKLLIPIERTGWRGSTYTAVFRKDSAI